MDAADLFGLLMPYFNGKDLKVTRQISRWHMDDPRSDVWLFRFRESLLTELCAALERTKEKVVRLDVRAQAMMALIRHQNRPVFVHAPLP